MRPQTPKEYLMIERWESEREAARTWGNDCLSPYALRDYAEKCAQVINGIVSAEEHRSTHGLNKTQLEHVILCRGCRVWFLDDAERNGLSAEQAMKQLKEDYSPPPPPSRPFEETQETETPTGRARVLSSRRKSADAAVDVQKEAADTFTWKRESGTVDGYLSFASSDGETVQPHVELKPLPGKTTFIFRYENGAKEIVLTIDSDGHSEPCEDVPVESLTDWELIAPDGELEWRFPTEFDSVGKK
jgi:hypothetical protein